MSFWSHSSSSFCFSSSYRLLHPGLRGLLDEIIGLPAATEFLSACVRTVIVSGRAAALVGAGHGDLKEGARFMEYVWSFAGSMQDVFQNLMIALLVYVTLATVLMAALRRKH